MISSNTLLVSVDGTTDEYRGVAYAEMADKNGDAGIAIQYVEQPHEDEPKTDFVVGGKILGVYGDQFDV